MEAADADPLAGRRLERDVDRRVLKRIGVVVGMLERDLEHVERCQRLGVPGLGDAEGGVFTGRSQGRNGEDEHGGKRNGWPGHRRRSFQGVRAVD